MGLQLRRVSSVKTRITLSVMTMVALVAQPLYSTLSSQIADALSPTVVTPSNMNGWMALDDNGQGGSLDFVAGPSNSPLGSGSAQLSVDSAGQGYMLYKTAYSGLKLSATSALSYKTFVQSGNNTIAPSLQINVDRDVTDSDGTWQGRLVYEPYMNGAVTDGIWQEWSPLAGKWWLSKPASFSGHCGQGAPCTTGELLSLFPNIGVNSGLFAGIGFKAGSSWTGFKGNVDAFTINNDIYNFEQLDSSKIRFISDQKYIRENGSDLVAQMVTYAPTSQVEFYVDGNTSAPIAGVNKGVSSAGFHEWRLTTPLAAGQHVITGRAMVSGQWYPITGTSTIYSLDTPTASYVLPSADTNIFRPGDNPVRLKVDDEYNQFKNVQFSLYNYSSATNSFGSHIGIFTVNRTQCDQRAAGNYVLCDIANSSTWANLGEGTYAIKLTTSTHANNGIRTNMPEYWSQPFSVDSTAPTVSGLGIENGNSGTVGDSAQVVVSASDNYAVESVNFYITTPRSDGVCTGNGAKLAEFREANAGNDGKYRAALNTAETAGVSSGTYCVTAVARDKSSSNSSPVHIQIKVDHTPPEVSLMLLNASAPTASTSIVLQGNVSERSTVELKRGGDLVATITDVEGDWQYNLQAGLPQGTYVFSIIVTDAYGNQATETLEVNVGAFAGGAPLALSLTDGLSTPFPTPRALGALPSTLGTAAPQDDTDVLGAQTEKNPTVDQNVKTAAIAATGEGWKLFGMLWYWWLLLGILVASIAWGVTALARRRVAQDI